MPDPNPIRELEKALDLRTNGHNKEAVLLQCKIFLALLQVGAGKYTSAQILTATKATLAAFGTPSWYQTEHELFLCILLDSGYVSLNRELRIVLANRTESNSRVSK